MADLAASIREAYAFEGTALDLGRGLLEEQLDREAVVRLPLATSNRHGLIAGATGTGKSADDPLERRRRLLRHPAPDRPAELGARAARQRIQHALRAFTPNDAAALRKTVRTYPASELYDLEGLLTSLGIGEAAVTVLDEQGVPTPVVHARLRAPRASMDPAPDLEAPAKASPLWGKYGTRLERETAAEALAKRVETAAEAEPAAEPAKKARAREKPSRDASDPLRDFMTSRQGKAIQREIVRGVFGMLKKRL